MTPLRPGHILFIVLSAAVILAAIRFYAPGLIAPGQPSVPSSPPAIPGPSPAPLSAPRPPPPVEEDAPQAAPAETEKGNPELMRWNIEDALARAIQEKLPEAGLSDRQIAQLAQSVRTLQESIAGLQGLERTPENAAAIEALGGAIEQETRTIEEITGMSAAAFFNRITTEGIDNEKPEKGEVVLEYLDPPGR